VIHLIDVCSHEGPGQQVAWAHPKYENVIATAGQDKKIKVWQEGAGSTKGSTKWDLIYEEILDSRVNCIAWAPWEYGMILATGTATGVLHIFTKTSTA
jgi:protein transport protein SEC13